MSQPGHDNPVLDGASLKRADRASDEAIDTINRALRLRNQGRVMADDIELTLVLLFTKYFNALTAMGHGQAGIRERFDAFQQALQMTFAASQHAASLADRPKRRCICHLSPSGSRFCPHDTSPPPSTRSRSLPLI